jgi:dimethylargininase
MVGFLVSGFWCLVSGFWFLVSGLVSAMIAITRDVSPSINACELTHLEPETIEVAKATLQHEQYRDVLASLGFDVVRIPADVNYPDCVFVEDTAVVLDDLAIITRPGAPSRRGETRAVAEILQNHRPLTHIEAPATIDGGDVLVLDDRIFVGLSQRTNEAAIGQLRHWTRRDVVPVSVHGCLHLKSAITRVSRDALLVNREWIDVEPFRGWTLIDVEEPFAANALLVNETVIYPASYPRTRQKLRHLDVRTVDVSELAKAEGGVTCCSLLVYNHRGHSAN